MYQSVVCLTIVQVRNLQAACRLVTDKCYRHFSTDTCCRLVSDKGYRHLIQTLAADKVLQARVTGSTVRQGIQLQVIRSRPDAYQVIRGVMAAHRQTPEISVFVAGKLFMLHDSTNAHMAARFHKSQQSCCCRCCMAQACNNTYHTHTCMHMVKVNA